MTYLDRIENKERLNKILNMFYEEWIKNRGSMGSLLIMKKKAMENGQNSILNELSTILISNYPPEKEKSL